MSRRNYSRGKSYAWSAGRRGKAGAGKQMAYIQGRRSYKPTVQTIMNRKKKGANNADPK